MKSYQKQTFHFISTIYGAQQKSKYNHVNIKKNSPYFSYFFSNFLSFDSRVFIFFMFCISSNKLNIISCGICLSFKSRHLELLFRIIVHITQLSSIGIFLGLWSRGLPCNFTEQLFFFHNCEWLLLII